MWPSTMGLFCRRSPTLKSKQSFPSCFVIHAVLLNIRVFASHLWSWEFGNEGTNDKCLNEIGKQDLNDKGRLSPRDNCSVGHRNPNPIVVCASMLYSSADLPVVKVPETWGPFCIIKVFKVSPAPSYCIVNPGKYQPRNNESRTDHDDVVAPRHVHWRCEDIFDEFHPPVFKFGVKVHVAVSTLLHKPSLLRKRMSDGHFWIGGVWLHGSSSCMVKSRTPNMVGIQYGWILHGSVPGTSALESVWLHPESVLAKLVL